MLKIIFSIVLGCQILMYLGLGWCYFFGEKSHIPVPYIVLHIIAAINLILIIAGVFAFYYSEPRTPLIFWSIVLALPSIFAVVLLYLLRFLPPRS